MSAETALSVDRIIERGEQGAGTSADRGAGWARPLDLLVTSANDDGGLTDAAAAALEGKLSELVADRLVAEATFAKDPAIRRRPLPVRFAVAGLARSGTTFLHRLLSCDPDVEFLPTWPAFHPVPPIGVADSRGSEVIAFVEEFRKTNSDAFRIHPLDADAPEEEVFLLQLSFASMLVGLTCPLPAYNGWLSTAHHRRAYEFAFDLLRVNEHAAGTPEGRSRVMKSPQFVLDLEVMTELAPSGVRPESPRSGRSGGLLLQHVREHPAHELPIRRPPCPGPRASGSPGRHVVARAGGTRWGPGRSNGVDTVRGRQLRTPDGGADRHRGGALRRGSPSLELASLPKRVMDEWLAAHPQNAGGAHHYDLADYGLDRATVEHALTDYLDRFQPGVEP